MTQYRVLTLDKISPLGLNLLSAERYTAGQVDRPDAILLRSHQLHGQPIADSVQAIGRAGAGTNNIPVKEMTARGVPVFNSPGANANAVKELVLAAMLMAARNIVPAIDFVRRLEGSDTELTQQVESGKKQFVGEELINRTLGVIGLGAIGGLVADAGLKLGMQVIGFDPGITVEAAWRLPNGVRRAQSVEEVLRNSDFISIHVPLLPATRHLINRERLDSVREGAVLLNYSREGIVDDAAAVESLQQKRLRAYFCDFPSNALKGQPGAVTTPHLGASTAEAEENCAIMVVKQLKDYLENGNISNSVNFPNVSMERASPYRVSLAHDNVPNMLGRISSTLAEQGFNIENLVNKSRDELAYTLLDVDRAVDDAALVKLADISGVRRVRLIPAAS